MQFLHRSKIAVPEKLLWNEMLNLRELHFSVNEGQRLVSTKCLFELVFTNFLCFVLLLLVQSQRTHFHCQNAVVKVTLSVFCNSF